MAKFQIVQDGKKFHVLPTRDDSMLTWAQLEVMYKDYMTEEEIIPKTFTKESTAQKALDTLNKLEDGVRARGYGTMYILVTNAMNGGINMNAYKQIANDGLDDDTDWDEFHTNANMQNSTRGVLKYMGYLLQGEGSEFPTEKDIKAYIRSFGKNLVIETGRNMEEITVKDVLAAKLYTNVKVALMSAGNNTHIDMVNTLAESIAHLEPYINIDMTSEAWSTQATLLVEPKGMGDAATDMYQSLMESPNEWKAVIQQATENKDWLVIADQVLENGY